MLLTLRAAGAVASHGSGRVGFGDEASAEGGEKKNIYILVNEEGCSGC